MDCQAVIDFMIGSFGFEKSDAAKLHNARLNDLEPEAVSALTTVNFSTYRDPVTVETPACIMRIEHKLSVIAKIEGSAAVVPTADYTEAVRAFSCGGCLFDCGLAN